MLPGPDDRGDGYDRDDKEGYSKTGGQEYNSPHHRSDGGGGGGGLNQSFCAQSCFPESQLF